MFDESPVAPGALLGMVRCVIKGTSSVVSVWYAVLSRLQVVLLGILITTASVVYEDRLPLLSAGGISFHVPDVLLIGSMVFVAVRSRTVPRYTIVRTPLDLPLLVFFAVTILSTAVAVARSSVDMHDAMRATRIFFYYLSFFVVTNLVRDRRQITFLVNSIITIATIVAVAMLGQYVLGDSVELLPGRIQALNTEGTTFDAVTRVAPPGLSIVLISLVTGVCNVAHERSKSKALLRLLQCGVLAAAVLVTFLRSYWLALTGVMIVMFCLVAMPAKRRLVRWLVVVFAVAAFGVTTIYSEPGSAAWRLVDAAWTRLRTLGSSGTFQGDDSSVDWRKIENGYALTAIKSSPLIGLGMGAIYRPWDSRLDYHGLDYRGSDRVYHDLRRLIHNGHLNIVLQSGIIGYVALCWLSFVFLKRGFGGWRGVANVQLGRVVLGFTLAYVLVLIAAVANSSFMEWRWTPVIGIMMGVNEAILRTAGAGEIVAARATAKDANREHVVLGRGRSARSRHERFSAPSVLWRQWPH